MWVVDTDDDKVYAYNMLPSDDASLSALTVDAQGHHRLRPGPHLLRGGRGLHRPHRHRDRHDQ